MREWEIGKVKERKRDVGKRKKRKTVRETEKREQRRGEGWVPKPL